MRRTSREEEITRAVEEEMARVAVDCQRACLDFSSSLVDVLQGRLCGEGAGGRGGSVGVFVR